MQSQNSTRLSMLSINVSASHGPLNVTSGMIWTTKGIDTLNPTTIIATVPLYKFPSLLLLYTLLIDTVQIFANTFHLSSKYSHMKKKTFSWTTCNAFNASTRPYWILSNNGKDSIGNFSSNNLFTWSDV